MPFCYPLSHIHTVPPWCWPYKVAQMDMSSLKSLRNQEVHLLLHHSRLSKQRALYVPSSPLMPLIGIKFRSPCLRYLPHSHVPLPLARTLPLSTGLKEISCPFPINLKSKKKIKTKQNTKPTQMLRVCCNPDCQFAAVWQER